MANFKIGDGVRMRDGTAVWERYPALRMARGRVMGTVPDDAEHERITVEFPDGTSLPGLDAAMFDPV